MGFATIIRESEEDGKLRYSLIFDTLKEFEEREYIQFRNDFNDIFPNNNDDRYKGDRDDTILNTLRFFL